MSNDEVKQNIYLERRYMLLTFIPYFVDSDGSIWLDQLWHHDFREHMTYLRRLTLAAPRETKGSQQGLCKVEIPPGCEVSFAPLPLQSSFKIALINLPATTIAIARAIKRAEIVHSGAVGWPYPLGWIANPIALLLRKKLIIVIESSPWDSIGSSWKQRRWLGLMKRLARWSVNQADLAVFTHAGYQKELMTHGSGAVLIGPATWIAEHQIMSEIDALRRWDKLSSSKLRLLFAGRLTREKGVTNLLAALRELSNRGIALDVDIIGDGALKEECQAVAAGRGGTINVRYLDPVAYGEPFFGLLRGYHAVIVPSLTNEQPRIVFDAFSQSVALITSDTDGLKACVQDGVTGLHFQRDDVTSMAGILARYANTPSDLRTIGMNGRSLAHSFTHRGMHQRRRDALIDTFGR